MYYQLCQWIQYTQIEQKVLTGARRKTVYLNHSWLWSGRMSVEACKDVPYAESALAFQSHQKSKLCGTQMLFIVNETCGMTARVIFKKRLKLHFTMFIEKYTFFCLSTLCFSWFVTPIIQLLLCNKMFGHISYWYFLLLDYQLSMDPWKKLLSFPIVSSSDAQGLCPGSSCPGLSENVTPFCLQSWVDL